MKENQEIVLDNILEEKNVLDIVTQQKSPENLILSEEASAQDVKETAESIVNSILELNFLDSKTLEEKKAAIESVGIKSQAKCALQSKKLKEPIRKLAARTDDGGDIAKSLINLKIQVENLNPSRFDFKGNFLSQILGYIPGFGTPLKRYFSKYESSQAIIDAVIKSLEIGKEQLKRDDEILSEDQDVLRNLSENLENSISLAMLVDKGLVAKIENSEFTNEQALVIQENFQYPLRQRILDLQQQLAVNHQGILAMDLIKKNNKELIRGVDRALSVTVYALGVAVTVAMALEDQKIVLEKVDALKNTTSDLIANTAKNLKNQGVEIQKQASREVLDIDKLKSAFDDIRIAIDDISKFRIDSLPLLKESIDKMENMTSQSKLMVEREVKELPESLI